MESHKSTVRDLTLAIGLAVGLVALLLVCASQSAPPAAAAAPAPDDLEPVWTSTDPVTTTVDENLQVWVIEPYSVTVIFYRGAVSAPAVFTFTPRMDLKLPLPLVSTAYLFEIKGTYLNDKGREVSLAKPVDYELFYDESRLKGVSEHSLGLYYIFDGLWYDWPAVIDTGANRITWKTQWTGQFGFGGYGSIIYFPTILSDSRGLSAISDIQADE